MEIPGYRTSLQASICVDAKTGPEELDAFKAAVEELPKLPFLVRLLFRTLLVSKALKSSFCYVVRHVLGPCSQAKICS